MNCTPSSVALSRCKYVTVSLFIYHTFLMGIVLLLSCRLFLENTLLVGGLYEAGVPVFGTTKLLS